MILKLFNKLKDLLRIYDNHYEHSSEDKYIFSDNSIRLNMDNPENKQAFEKCVKIYSNIKNKC